MERSIVREYTGFDGQNNDLQEATLKNGIFRTFRDETDLRKSRIQNLLDYKKEDLSNRLGMVVVFQGIQIERLSLQVESLRMKLKDSQKQLNNYLSYQTKIKELTEKSSYFKRENEQYQEQIYKLNVICQKMYLQIQQLYRRHNHADPQLQDKYNALFRQKKLLQKEMQQITKSFANRNQQIVRNNQSLKQKVASQENQIQALSSFLNKSEQKAKQTILQEKFKVDIQPMIKEINLLSNNIYNKQHQIVELKTFYEENIRKMEMQNKEQREKRQTYERQNKLIRAQMENVKHEFQMSKRNIELAEIHNNQLTHKMNNMNEQFVREIAIVNLQKQFIQRKINDFLDLLETKASQLEKLKGFVSRMKKQQETVQNQKQNLSSSLKSTLAQMEKLYQQLEIQKHSLFQLRTQRKDLEYKVRQLQNDIKMLQVQTKILQNQVNRVTQEKHQSDNELRRMEEHIKQLNKRTQQIKKNHTSVLQKLHSEHESQLKSVQKSLNSALAEIETTKNNQYLQTLQKATLTQQITHLRQLSEIQCVSINKIMNSIQMSQKLLKQVMSQQEKNISQNSEKIKPALAKTNQIFAINESWVNQIIQMQDFISLLENENLKLQSENYLLNFQLQEIQNINSMQKRRQSNTSANSISITSFINSNSMLNFKEKQRSFIRRNSQQSLDSEITESQPSERRIFAPINSY